MIDCSWTKPITLSPRDQQEISMKAFEQIVAHNELYDEKCIKKKD